MSWSVNAIGKPAAVAAKLAKDFANIKCIEPEESIKNQVAATIAVALSVYPPTVVVNVAANGSQFTPDSTKPSELQNTLTVKLEPMYGFVE